jgi:hypothetical protein
LYPTHTALSLATFLLCAVTHAGPLSPETVPEPLRPWIDWVLLDHEDRSCPLLYDADKRKCAWPARLVLSLADRHGEFTQSWRVYAESWVMLPGDKALWPQDIQVSNAPALVRSRQGRPAVRLEPGLHSVSGTFGWDKLPESLTIPADSGLVALTVHNRSIDFPDIDPDGRLWLREREVVQEGEKAVGARLDLQVFRRLIDDNPMRLITRIGLEVAGIQREVVLDRVLLEGFIPLKLDSHLPARLDRLGRLHIQVRPGHWSIELTGRHPQYLTRLSLNQVTPPCPDEEVWVFDAKPQLRLVEVKGPPVVDPRQTNLPKAWQNLPAYLMKSGDSLSLDVVRRGDPDPQPDRLKLERTMWLDFSGQGYTFQDRITGSMTRGWRLEVNPQIDLGSVVIDGEPQFITTLPDQDKRGVEVRRGAIDLIADSRYVGQIDTLPAVGWDHDFKQLNATLHLPPGWRLFSVSGVDNVPNTWLQRWTLLDLFVVLIAAIAVTRLWDWKWGVLALAGLVLIWHESDAPRYVWLNILAAVALLRVLPPGRIRFLMRWYRNLGLIALVLIALPFLVEEARIGLYPQLEHPWQRLDTQVGKTGSKRMEAQAKRPQETTPATSALYDYDFKSAPREAKSSLDAPYRGINPKANIQTGPGLPHWQWTSVPLTWQGPVERDQSIQLLLVSPSINLVLNLLRVLLLIVLAWRIFERSTPRGKGMKSATAVAATVFFLSSIVTPMGAEAKAEFPNPKILKELETRLLQPPDCLPSCAQIARLRLDLTDRHLRARIEVHALEETAIPLPVDLQQWVPQQVMIDDVESQALFRTPSARLWIEVTKGQHLILLSGLLPGHDRIQLPLPLRPHHVEVHTDTWSIQGVHENGVADRQLQFTRIHKQVSEQRTSEAMTLPPFVRIERTLLIGLDWRIKARIERLSPKGVPVVLRVPLLAGESVLSDGVRVKQGMVLVNMAPEQSQMHWESSLDGTPQIRLKATDNPAWSELWRADIAPIWHAEFGGIPVVHHQDPSKRWLPEWRPWPGEELKLNITRPQGVEGQTITIDSTRLQQSAGRRAADFTLELVIRSSRGDQHTLILPEQARLQSVTIDGVAQPIRQDGRLVTLPIKPGRQLVRLNWIISEGIPTWLETPRVNLGASSVNSSITVKLSRDRWVLLTGGPRLGPAVLFWGVLLIIILIAFGLARVRLTPLKYWHWLLLGIGLSQAPVWAAIFVVGWLFALGARAKMTVEVSKLTFNSIQIGLILLTLFALSALFSAIQHGLLGVPEMQIAGNHSSAYELNWYQDRIGSTLPQAWVLSVPLLVYRLLMLAWALWLAFALLTWLRWGWECFSRHGIWRAIKFELKNFKLLKPQRSSTDQPSK